MSHIMSSDSDSHVWKCVAGGVILGLGLGAIGLLAAVHVAPRPAICREDKYKGKKVAVILSGCGVYDGSEIQESCAALVHLSKSGATVSCFAPDKAQHHVRRSGKSER